MHKGYEMYKGYKKRKMKKALLIKGFSRTQANAIIKFKEFKYKRIHGDSLPF
jgi:hypothetical protein